MGAGELPGHRRRTQGQHDEAPEHQSMDDNTGRHQNTPAERGRGGQHLSEHAHEEDEYLGVGHVADHTIDEATAERRRQLDGGRRKFMSRSRHEFAFFGVEDGWRAGEQRPQAEVGKIGGADQLDDAHRRRRQSGEAEGDGERLHGQPATDAGHGTEGAGAARPEAVAQDQQEIRPRAEQAEREHSKKPDDTVVHVWSQSSGGTNSK